MGFFSGSSNDTGDTGGTYGAHMNDNCETEITGARVEPRDSDREADNQRRTGVQGIKRYFG
jgi:hypothetical protein